MNSSRPYLLRALYEWILDNDCTPYVLVDANAEGALVPLQYVKDGEIVLNISPSAVASLDMDNSAVMFNARFGGVPTDVYVPIHAVRGIYARENGQGMMFEAEDMPPPIPPEDPVKPKRPALKVVK
ncbi:MAG: ClpXP protease specificity-enhancing factor [Pseudomonadales bacterium]